jgi:hypothetical protein
LSTSIHSILWPSDGADGESPSNGMNPALVMSRFGVTHIASMGVRERYRLNVAGGDLDGCEVKMTFWGSFSWKAFDRLQSLTSSFISIHTMMLSPISFNLCISATRSMSNWMIGSEDATCCTDRMYLHCWVHTVLIPLFRQGRYAETILV